MTNAGIKLLPLLLFSAGVLAAIIWNRRFRVLSQNWITGLVSKNHGNYFGLALLGVLITAVIVIPASAKNSSNENYFFMLTFFIALLLLSALERIRPVGDWPILVALPFSLG